MIYQRIRYFLKTAELGSFSKAATEMYITPQALTKQIGLLEEELGGTLFYRSFQGVTLTSLGMEAQKSFAKLDQELNQSLHYLKQRAKDEKERINIGIFSALPQEQLVTPFISFLMVNFPNYTIELNLLDLDEAKTQLLEGKIDLLLTNTHLEEQWSPNRVLSFASHPAKVIVSLRHPWAVKSEITPEDMMQENFLKMHITSEVYKTDPKNFFYKNIPCKNVREVSNFDTMYTLLQQGNAFAVFPLAFTHMETSKLKSFSYPGKTLMFYTALIYNPNNQEKMLQEIVTAVQEEFDLKEV